MNRLFSPEDRSVGCIHDQLAHLVKTQSEMLDVARSVQLLTRKQISVLIETAFWASLRFNEGRTTSFCVAVAAPENFHNALAFATPVAYEESQVVKLAPACSRRSASTDRTTTSSACSP